MSSCTPWSWSSSFHILHPQNAVKARSYLPFYKRAGRMPAVVDYVLSASRLKVIISRENAKLTMVLGGVRCPKHARTQTDVAEPFGDEAMAFVSQKCLQHDVYWVWLLLKIEMQTNRVAFSRSRSRWRMWTRRARSSAQSG